MDKNKIIPEIIENVFAYLSHNSIFITKHSKYKIPIRNNGIIVNTIVGKNPFINRF